MVNVGKKVLQTSFLMDISRRVLSLGLKSQTDQAIQRMDQDLPKKNMDKNQTATEFPGPLQDPKDPSKVGMSGRRASGRWLNKDIFFMKP